MHTVHWPLVVYNLKPHLLVVLLVWSCLLLSRKFARTLRRTGITQRVWLQGRTRTRPAAGLVALLTATERACMLMICSQGYNKMDRTS
jgi:hypothetical protein